MSDSVLFVPSIRMPVLPRTFVKESVTLLTDDGQANVIASSEPLDPSWTCTDYATSQGEVLRREFAGYQESEFAPRQVFGLFAGYRRIFSWSPPNNLPMTQIQTYYAMVGRGYTVTGTTPTATYATYGPWLEQIVDGVRLDT